MLKLVKKNNLVAKKNVLNASKIYIYKILLTDYEIINLLDREKIRKYFNKANQSISLTRFRKICSTTNRARGNVSLYNLSRFKVKFLAWEGLLVGLKRFSW